MGSGERDAPEELSDEGNSTVGDQLLEQSMESHYLAFKIGSNEIALSSSSIPRELQTCVWRPQLFNPFPPYPAHNRVDEMLLHWLHLMFFLGCAVKRRGKAAYHVVTAADSCRKVCAIVGLRHADFRFPFMAPDDIQFGPVWVASNYRNRGLATSLCRMVLENLTDLPPNIWWVCRSNNEPSKRLAKSLGFREQGSISRTRYLGLPFFHSYGQIEQQSATRQEKK